MRTNWLFLSLLLVTALTGACSSKEAPAPVFDRAEGAIVGGTTETGWPAVGALTIRYPGYGYGGSFCTAALIDDEWVLTAAHCLLPSDEFNPSPEVVQFYIGNDARESGFAGWPTSGSFYDTDQFYVHPDYDGNEYDIALAHLADRVTDVTPLPISSTAMSGSWNGDEVFYVGFGVNNGATGTGGGLKRSASIPIYTVDTRTYTSEYDGQGVCFGDSGGPGLVQLGGVWKIVGVNSAVSGSGSDPCRGFGIHTRVDAFATWVSNRIGAAPPNCNTTAGMCYCATACQADGRCNNAVCQTLECGGIYECFAACGETDDACQTDCYLRGTDGGRTLLDEMYVCFQERCANATTDTAFQQCIEQYCQSEVDACFPTITGDDTCEEVYDCLGGCPDSDTTCLQNCYNGGTEAAQAAYIAMVECFDAQCGTITDPTAWSTCASQRCGQQVDACIVPANCDITGGGCAAGEGCYPTSTGATDCYPSDGIAVGAPCDTAIEDRLVCADGALCLTERGAATCHAFCRSDSECAAQDLCQKPIFSGLADVGVCVCRDADDDGWCLADDCDDTVRTIHPEATEACGNTKDDDCDGDIDEGCPVCTDADRDGFCAEEADCDDTQAAVNPDATETCGNGRDDNCNARTDEGCVVCTDADADTYCAEEDDCDDTRATVHPGAVEACGNDVDDDCDERTDEGCDVCEDADSDGYCVQNDCDDTSATVFPGAEELCDNSVDDDCDERVDEGCTVCTDADADSWCAADDCDDARAEAHPGAAEACGNGTDEDCDGTADNGCGTCVDEDEDGYCVGAGDCDDGRPTVFEGAEELCGDRLDNDCDGRLDEGCGPCVDGDEDGDGSCAGDDCDDRRAAVFPGATEVCDDRLDNDCDGQVDEGCAACTDADADGVCATAGDCDDTRAAVRPGVAEVCGDRLDNDCNGKLDDGCAACTDADGDGVCATAGDCDDTRIDVNPSATEICDNGLDEDCDGTPDDGCTDGDPDDDPSGTDEPVTPGELPGSSGCATGGSSSGPALPLLALFFGLALRRRMARRPS